MRRYSKRYSKLLSDSKAYLRLREIVQDESTTFQIQKSLKQWTATLVYDEAKRANLQKAVKQWIIDLLKELKSMFVDAGMASFVAGGYTNCRTMEAKSVVKEETSIEMCEMDEHDIGQPAGANGALDESDVLFLEEVLRHLCHE